VCGYNPQGHNRNPLRCAREFDLIKEEILSTRFRQWCWWRFESHGTLWLLDF